MGLEKIPETRETHKKAIDKCAPIRPVLSDTSILIYDLTNIFRVVRAHMIVVTGGRAQVP